MPGLSRPVCSNKVKFASTPSKETGKCLKSRLGLSLNPDANTQDILTHLIRRTYIRGQHGDNNDYHGESNRPATIRLFEDHCFECSARLDSRSWLSPQRQNFLAAPDMERISCVVSDLLMAGVDGLAVQQVVHAKMPHLSMVFITGHGDVPASVTAMKAGARSTSWRSR